MQSQLVLDRSQFFHQCVHLFFVCAPQKIADLIHPLFFLKQRVKSRFQHFLDRHAFFEDGVLVKVACVDVFCPFYLAFIRHQFPCENAHESRLAFSVRSNKSDMFSFKKSKRNI